MIEAAKLMVEVGADTADAERDLKGVGKTLENMTRDLTRTGGILTGAIGAPLVAAAAGVFKAGSSFESAFTGVIKTVDATDAEIAGLRDGLRTMSREIPVSANALADVAAAAGQLGIETENILGFTRVMADLGVTTNLSAENAATSLARLANITQMPQEDFDRLGSTIVALGNNLATTESEIVAMGLRIAAAGNQVGMSEAQILGLAGALSSVGIEAEAGGSAISRVIIDMANAVASGDKRLSLFAQTAGMSSAQFERAFETNAAGALITFVGGLDEVSRAGGNVFEVLDQLGLGEIRVRDALLRAAGAGTLFGDSLDIASGAWEENIALTKEAETRYGTVESKLQTIANGVNDIAIGLYDRVRPMLVGALDGVAGVVDTAATALGALPQPALEAGLAFFGVVAGAGALMLVLAGVATAITAVSWPLVAVAVGAGLLAAAWTTNWGDIQTKTSDAVALITPEIDKLVTKVGEFGTAVGTAFANTKFPSVNDLWENFKTGDFETIASTIRSTTFELLVNLDAELNITAKANDLKQKLIGVVSGLGTAIAGLDFSGAQANLDGLRDGILSGLTTAIDGISFGEAGTAFSGLVNEAKVAIAKMDFSGIDWASVLAARFVGPAMLAVKGIAWAMDSGNFEGLKASVTGAIAKIPWDDIGTSLAGLGAAINGQLALIGADIIRDVDTAFAKLTGIKLLPESIRFIVPALPAVTLPPPPLTVQPSPPITVPAPQIMVAPPKQAFDFNWEAFGAFPAKIARGMTTAILAYNWTGTGEVLGTMIVGWFHSEIEKAKAWANLPKNTAAAAGGALAGVLNIEKWFTEFSVQLGREISAGWAGANSGGAFAALGGAIKQGLDEMIDGLMTSIMGSFMTLSFDPKITKGPDPILSQQKNLLNPLAGAANAMFAEFFTAFTESAASTARNMAASIGGFFTGLGTSFLTGIASLGTQIKARIADLFANPFGSGESGVQGRGGKPLYSLRRGESDQPDIGAFEWADVIEPLAWPNFITLLQWEAFVPYIYWGSFIPHVEWGGFIPDVSWGDWVPSLDWGRFVPAFGAPQSAFASGTNYAPGGYALVGERGPEIVNLPRGSRVYDAQTSAAMMEDRVTLHIENMNINSDMDVHTAATKLAREFRRRIR